MNEPRSRREPGPGSFEWTSREHAAALPRRRASTAAGRHDIDR